MRQKKQLNVEIGSRIQQARERAGMTQEQLAETIDRSTQFISTIERGVAGASLETIVLLCKTLNTSADWLLLGVREMTSATVAAKLAALNEAQLEEFDRLTGCVIKILEQKE